MTDPSAHGFQTIPDLVAPVMVVAFEGWNDAGDSATEAIEHLEDVWSAAPWAELDPEPYYDYQVNRPMISVDDDQVRHISWPTTRLSIARIPLAQRDVVLVRGIEPNMRWRGFCAEIINYARALQVEMVVCLGALLADTPHTRPVPVTGVTTDERLVEDLGFERSTYQGPTGIVGVLQVACQEAAIPAVSLWAAIPHYVAQPPCPKATLALLTRLEDLLDVPVPLAELAEESAAWQVGVDELASDDQEVADYVRHLEETQDAADLPEATGEAIAREFERYLRRRGSEG